MPKSKKTQTFEQRLSPIVGPILLFSLVAVSSFLLGKNYQTRQTPESATVSAATTKSSGNTSAIDSIQQSLSSPSKDTSIASTQTATNSTRTISPSPTSTNGIVNINSADLTTLETLKGIGATKAQAILDYRTQNGPFVSIEDLGNVKGIGPKTLDNIRSQITI